MDSDYISFFLRSKSTVVQFETIEISHPDFNRDYFVVRNKTDGLTAKLENSADQFFEYYPIKFDYTSAQDDLDYSLDLTFGDLGEVLPTELDAVNAASGFDVKPSLKYRTYRSDDLSKPMLGPIVLEVFEIGFNKTGATLRCRAPSLNVNKTGETYTVHRFPMLKSTI